MGKDYTESDVKEMRELMVDNYHRCLVLDVPANVDGVLYYVDSNDKIVAYGCDNENEDTIMLTDLFDDIDTRLLSKARKVKNVVFHKNSLDTSIFEDYYIDVNIDAEYAVDIEDKRVLNNFFYQPFFNKCIKSLKLKNACFIRKSALKNAKNLTSLILGRVHTIEDEGLSDCINLSNIDFSRVEYFGTRACANCKSLKYADLSGVTELKKDTFLGCENLEVVRLSSKCKKIEDAAFSQCDNLKLIEFSGTQKEWYELSQNLKYWRTGLYSRFAYKNHRLRMKYVE